MHKKLDPAHIGILSISNYVYDLDNLSLVTRHNGILFEGAFQDEMQDFERFCSLLSQLNQEDSFYKP